FLQTTFTDKELIKTSDAPGRCRPYAGCMATLLSFCQWLGNTPFTTGIRESTWVYPVIESVHVLSLCVFVGLLLLWDLRLVGGTLRGVGGRGGGWGLFRGLRLLLDLRLVGVTLRRGAVSEVWSWLIPWITLGAALMVISGLLLFAS